jgi:putative toxin-antitoxin system antitoxin component (TIGR02293 family)
MASKVDRATTHDPFATIERLRAGLPYKVLEDLVAKLGLSREEVARSIGIPPRTLIRRKHARRLNAAESDRVHRLEQILASTIDLLGDRDSAIHWLTTPHPALGMTVPLSLLDTDVGAAQVREILGRIRYGMYS